MKRLLLPVVGALFWLPASAQSPVDACARARDPLRCEARQTALKACSGKRGAGKQACLEAGMPPVDCGKASNPPKCKAAQEARKTCKDKAGKDLKKCMRDEQQKKSPGPGTAWRRTDAGFVTAWRPGATQFAN